MRRVLPRLPSDPFSAEQRLALLGEYHRVCRGLDEISRLMEQAQGKESSRLAKHESFYVERLNRVRGLYRAGLPLVPLARCPFTKVMVLWHLDHHGLDGLYWDYDAPVRPLESLPPTFFSLTGAVKLRAGVDNTPILCVPGPEVPYVVPRVLRHPAVKAVISSFDIGEHQGVAVTYFARPVPKDLLRINTWGTSYYTFRDHKDRLDYGTYDEDPKNLDFDIARWILADRLLWIEPGDDALVLRGGISGCPYLELEGTKEIQRIQNGEVWSATQDVRK